MPPIKFSSNSMPDVDISIIEGEISDKGEVVKIVQGGMVVKGSVKLIKKLDQIMKKKDGYVTNVTADEARSISNSATKFSEEKLNGVFTRIKLAAEEGEKHIIWHTGLNPTELSIIKQHGYIYSDLSSEKFKIMW